MSSPLTSTRGGGGWVRLGILFGIASSSRDTWKTGWIVWRCSGSHKVNECVPGWAMMLKGLRYFLESFLDGRVVQMYSALTNTCWPTRKSSAGKRRGPRLALIPCILLITLSWSPSPSHCLWLWLKGCKTTSLGPFFVCLAFSLFPPHLQSSYCSVVPLSFHLGW